jgi:alpha-D-xyloside xylohydrolase
MTAELKSMGISLMVSIWATVESRSENWDKMIEESLVIKQDRGLPMHKESPAGYRSLFIDPTNPKTRSFVWDTVKRNYLDKGVDLFWLDVAEPQFTAMDFELYRMHRGSYLSIGNAYPNYYTKIFYDGMTSSDSTPTPAKGLEVQPAKTPRVPINLARCAWAGGQKLGLLLWSGDVASSWLSMKWQFAAGLNAGLAGMSWWTADIGGFHGGDIHDPAFHELFVRWFQWGTFLPVMRLHGDRDPQKPKGQGGAEGCGNGADNEVWTYGEDVYEICKTYLFLREKMRSYTRGLMQEAHEHGDAVIRPMFYVFPQDEACWKLEDQYMFGNKYLVAPVFAPGTTSRKVYLPKGAKWRQLTADGSYTDDTTHGGSEGQFVSVKCPIEYMPVFERV